MSFNVQVISSFLYYLKKHYYSITAAEMLTAKGLFMLWISSSYINNAAKGFSSSTSEVYRTLWGIQEKSTPWGLSSLICFNKQEKCEEVWWAQKIQLVNFSAPHLRFSPLPHNHLKHLRGVGGYFSPCTQMSHCVFCDFLQDCWISVRIWISK